MIQRPFTLAPSAAPTGTRAKRTLASLLALTSLFLLAVSIIPEAGAF
jgi:hypothetical protein